MDGRYAVGENIVGADIYTESMDGDYDQFEKRVVALDIKCRVALGEAKCLSLGKSGGIAFAMVEDTREDII